MEAVTKGQSCVQKAEFTGKPELVTEAPSALVWDIHRSSMNIQGRVFVERLIKWRPNVHLKGFFLNNNILNFCCLSLHSLPASDYSVYMNLLVHFS